MSLDEAKRRKSWDLFKYAVEIAQSFRCETVHADSFTPPLEFDGPSPYKEKIQYGERYKVRVDQSFRWNDQWKVMVETFGFFTN